MHTTPARCSWLLLAAVLLLAGGGATATAAPAGPSVLVRPLAGEPSSGSLAGLDAEGARIEDAAGTRTVPLDSLVELRFAQAAGTKAKRRRFRAHLVGGDTLVGALVGPSDVGLRMDVEGLGGLDLSFDALRTLEALPASAGPGARPADRAPRIDSGDIAYDLKWDEYRGTVLEGTADAVVIEGARERRRRVSWDDLLVLHLLNDALPPAAGLQGEAELATGSRIALAGVPRYTPQGLVLESRSMPKVELTVPFASLSSLRWWGGKFTYASMLPFESSRTPYHQEKPSVVDPTYRDRFFAGTSVDRRLKGRPLTVGGLRFRRGFGVISHSRIEVPLDGAFTSFRTAVGIDDEVLLESGTDGALGNVDVRVLGDDKVLWEAKGIQGGQQARRVGPLDVSGVQKLVLEVDFGSSDDPAPFALDRADWLDPILVRK